MKTFKPNVLLLILLFYAVSGRAQTCVNSLKTESYDTIFTGSGNAVNTLTFPRFDISHGTLMEVQLTTAVTLHYSFQLENRELVTISNYRVRVTRDDETLSPSLLSSIFTSQTRNYGPYTLTATDGVPGSGTDYLYRSPFDVLSNYSTTTSVFNTADFMGIGNVTFDHYSTTYSAVLGSVNYTFNATATDSVYFRITYIFCPSWFLAADLLYFKAVPETAERASLKWETANEESGRRYEIQASTDGRNYQTVENLAARPDALQRGNYNLSVNLNPYRNNRVVIFRIRQIEKDGTIKLSPLQAVNLQQTSPSGIRMYPNPASGFTQLFTGATTANWQVDLYSLQGQLLYRKQADRTRVILLDGLDKLPRGQYLVKVTNRQTNEQMQQHLLLQ